MKRITALLSALLLLVFSFGCAKPNTEEASVKEQVPTEAAVEPSSVPTAEPTPTPTEAAAETPSPTEAPVPERTPYPSPDLSGYRIVSKRIWDHVRTPVSPGPVELEGLDPELEDPENDGALFEVLIEYQQGIDAKLPEDVAERIRTERNAFYEKIGELQGTETGMAFEEDVFLWLDEWCRDCPYRNYFYIDDCVPVTFYYSAMGDPAMPFLDEFLDHLRANGENEKAELYAPFAEELWQAFYGWKHIPAEYAEVMEADLLRLAGLGLRIDFESVNEKFPMTCLAYLTREQIENFPNDPDLKYYIYFADCYCNDYVRAQEAGAA